MMEKTVSILYGLGEGPKIGKPLVHELQRAGFKISEDPSKADIIIAHSGGVCYLPKVYKATLILLIGVNYEFAGGVFKLHAQKLNIDFTYAMKTKRFWPWLQKSIWNTFYIFGRFDRTKYMWKVGHGKRPLLPTLKNTKVIVLNYKDDPWSANVLKTQLENYPNYILLGHAGVHDDIWIHPEYYVNLVQTLLSSA